MINYSFLKRNVVLIAAIGIVAMTSAFNEKFDDVTFHYQGSSFDQNSVETASNWNTSPPSGIEGCGEVDEVTCSIKVSDEFEKTDGTLDGSLVTVHASSGSGPELVTDVTRNTSGNPSLNPTLVTGEEPE